MVWWLYSSQRYGPIVNCTSSGKPLAYCTSFGIQMDLPIFYAVMYFYLSFMCIITKTTGGLTTSTRQQQQKELYFFFLLLLFFKGCELKEIESSSRFCGCPVALLAVSSSQHHMIHVFQRVCDTSGYHRWCWPKLFNQEEKPVFLPLHLLNQWNKKMSM